MWSIHSPFHEPTASLNTALRVQQELDSLSYDCVVCIKYVPDSKRVTGEAMTEDGTVNRAEANQH